VSNLNLSPNPAADYLQVTFTLDRPDRVTFEIMGYNGEVKMRIPGRQFTRGRNSLVFNTGNLMPGIYLLRARGNTGSFTAKFAVR